ncbi:MAG TPA: TonB-dependent receptor plug domain-containing protein, partial [Sphingobacterium sp.]|nr:TonB-dependent receptor plug domain-containing protein [Sphingobacterium sp.]
MRLIVILLVIGMHISVFANAQRVTLNHKNVSLTTILKEIKQQTGYNFLYDVDAVGQILNLTLDVRNTNIIDALDRCFKDLPLRYVIQGKNVIISKKNVTPPTTAIAVEPLQHIISGTVRNENGNPLSGVSVQIKGVAGGTMTNERGVYTLELPTPTSILVFSYVGFATEEASTENRAEINIVLKAQDSDLEEVVVVGYGTLARRSVTSAVSSLDGKELESKPFNTIGDGLKGKIAGVRVYSTDNQPGVSPVFRIRGGSSINKSNSPLILVDGVERDIVGLNPNDIESISALKDAASTAIYGAKASNGVILVTTKKGVSKDPAITFEASTAHQEKVQSFKTMNSEDFIRTMRTAVAEGKYPERNFANNYAASSGNTANSIYTTRYLADGEAIPDGYKSMTDPLDPTRTLVFEDNSFMDRYFMPNMWQNYYVGALGGDNRVKYNFSLGYTDDDGIAVSTGYKRVTVHGNTEFKISDKLSVEGGYDYSENVTADLPDNKTTYLQRTFSIPNVQRVFWPDTGLPVHSINRTTIAPDWYEYYFSRERTQKYSTGIATLTWQPINDLKIVAKGTNSDRYSRYNGFIKETNYGDPRSATATFTSTTRRNMQAYANYFKTFADIHDVNIMAG